MIIVENNCRNYLYIWISLILSVFAEVNGFGFVVLYSDHSSPMKKAR